jgi:hypothetical protein
MDADVLIPNYVISEDGRTWSVRKKKYLKAYTGPNGYPYVTLNGKVDYIHRILAKLFIPNPEDKPEVNHKDYNRSNFNLNNLEWVTTEENIQHAYLYELRKKVESYNHPNASLSKEEIIEIFNSDASERKTAEKYNTSARTVHNIRHGIRHQWALKEECTLCNV